MIRRKYVVYKNDLVSLFVRTAYYIYGDNVIKWMH